MEPKKRIKEIKFIPQVDAEGEGIKNYPAPTDWYCLPNGSIYQAYHGQIFNVQHYLLTRIVIYEDVETPESHMESCIGSSWFKKLITLILKQLDTFDKRLKILER